MITIVSEESDHVVKSGEVQAALDAMKDKGTTLWIDMETPTPDEFKILQDVFHFHPLAIEDACQPHQRPKLDEYDGYFFVTANEVLWDETSKEKQATSSEFEGKDYRVRQVSMFLSANYFITIHVEPVETVQKLRKRCDVNSAPLHRGPDYLLYTLLDALVDGYFTIVDNLDIRMDMLEDMIVAESNQNVPEKIFSIRRDLMGLRRHVGPMRQVVQTLTTRDMPHVQERTLPYLRDVADHLFRIYEMIDNNRDLLSNMLEAYLAEVSNNMNRVMQRLAAVGTVFLPITFVTGVFGMNFADQPWLKTNVWLWMGGMAVLAGFTFWWFHRRRWV